MINVGAAWSLLKTNIKTAQISSSVAVNTALSAFLKTPDFGVGIYDREGVTAGQTYSREYTFVRSSGGSKAVTCNQSPHFFQVPTCLPAFKVGFSSPMIHRAPARRRTQAWHVEL